MAKSETDKHHSEHCVRLNNGILCLDSCQLKPARQTVSVTVDSDNIVTVTNKQAKEQ